jgi:hypothetical protein
MNRNEAKLILGSCHPGHQTATDVQLRQALEFLDRDAELAAWFAEEQAIDARLSKSFREFPVPPALKERLLAARNSVTLVPWWRRHAWISAAAACLALVGMLAVLLTRSPGQREFAEFRSYAAEAAGSLDHLDLETSDYRKIRQWLEGHNAPDNFTLPGRLNGKSNVGCRLFQWNGQKVSLVCFEIGNKKVAHLFVMARSTFTNLPGSGTPQFSAAPNGIATAGWSDAQHVYILALKDGEKDLRQLLL